MFRKQHPTCVVIGDQIALTRDLAGHLDEEALALLEPGYAARSVATFEMFPQTSHVEIVVALERRRP